jgi:hypothetical protein
MKLPVFFGSPHYKFRGSETPLLFCPSCGKAFTGMEGKIGAGAEEVEMHLLLSPCTEVPYVMASLRITHSCYMDHSYYSVGRWARDVGGPFCPRTVPVILEGRVEPKKSERRVDFTVYADPYGLEAAGLLRPPYALDTTL